MKKIIDGKMYNTETARLIGEWEYGNGGDFDYYAEKLYRKKNGEFFLFGQGGAKSHYSRQLSYNSFCGGSGFTPLSIEDAKDLVEQHLDADIYIELFGEPEE